MKKIINIFITAAYLVILFNLNANAYTVYGPHNNNSYSPPQASDLILSYGTVNTSCNSWFRTTTCSSRYVEDPAPEIDGAGVILGLLFLALLIGIAAEGSSLTDTAESSVNYNYNPLTGLNLIKTDSVNLNILKINPNKYIATDYYHYVDEPDIEIFKLGFNF